MFIDFILDRFKENQNSIALVWQENNFTYKWLLDEFDKYIKYLVSNEIQPGSLVAVRSDFNPYSVAFLLALIQNRNIIVPISNAVKTIEEFYNIAQIEFEIEIIDHIPHLTKYDRKVDHEILLSLRKTENPGLILFSSGSTGKSKAAVHDFVPLLNKFKAKRHTLRTITFLLFDHIGGINTLLYILSNVGTIVAPSNRDPENICRLIEKYKVELLPTSPTFISLLLISNAYEKYNLSSLKMITYGTEAMADTILKKFNDLFPDIQLKQTYGLSELGILRSKSKSSNSLWVKVGGEDYQTKVVDDILYIKAKSAMLGYLNAPSPFDDNGWFNTQDKVVVDGEWIKILGRESDIINVGGQKVYPTEVESVLLQMDNISDVYVFAKKNQLLGNIVSAKVFLKNSENLQELKNRIRVFCKDKLESFKIPIDISIADDLQVSTRFKKIRK